MQIRRVLNLGIIASATLVASVTLVTGCATGSRNGDSSKSLSKTERARLFVDAAGGALNEGDATGALQFLAQAEQLAPELPELHHTRAVAFFTKNDLKTALLSARKAVELSPTYSDANNTLGKLLVDSGLYRDAEAPLIKAASDSLYRAAYKAHTNLAIMYYRQSKFAKAKHHAEKAVNEAPQYSCVASYYLGHLYLKEGKFSEATRFYDSATHGVCASFADAHLALGIAYERNRKYDQARKKFLDIKNAFPNTKVAEQAMSRLKYLE